MARSLHSVLRLGAFYLRLQRHTRQIDRDDILHRPRELAGLAPMPAALCLSHTATDQRIPFDYRDAIDLYWHDDAKANQIVRSHIQRADGVCGLDFKRRSRGNS